MNYAWLITILVAILYVRETTAIAEDIEATPTNTLGLEIGELSFLQYIIMMLTFLQLVFLYSVGILPLELDLGGILNINNEDRLNEIDALDLPNEFFNQSSENTVGTDSLTPVARVDTSEHLSTVCTRYVSYEGELMDNARRGRYIISSNITSQKLDSYHGHDAFNVMRSRESAAVERFVDNSYIIYGRLKKVWNLFLGGLYFGFALMQNLLPVCSMF